MARPSAHPSETILDGARAIVLESGAGSATVDAIARATGAPTGSIYHRFASRDELLARVWLRAVRRSQARFLAAIDRADPVEAAVAGALSMLDFCRDEPEDARLLASVRADDLLRADVPEAVARELADVNRDLFSAVRRLSVALFGRRTDAALQRTLLAVFDLPYGAARRHLVAGAPLPRTLWGDLERAVRAVIT